MHLEDHSLPRPQVAVTARSADSRLVEQLRRGDADAGRRFVHDYYREIHRYLLHLTSNREAAEDLTQETFVQAWRSLDTLEDGARLRPWLYRIAHREFLQALRGQRPVASLDDMAEPSERRAVEATNAVELRAILRGLPIEEREMVVLHYLEGYNSEEIARIVGVPAGTVRYRLSEARARLRRELDGEAEGRNSR